MTKFCLVGLIKKSDARVRLKKIKRLIKNKKNTAKAKNMVQ